MTLLRVEHIPAGDKSAKVTWDIEFEDLTVAEVIQLEELCDKFEPYIVSAIQNGSKADIMNLLYLWRQRTEPNLQWDEIASLRARDLVFSNPKPAKKAAAPKARTTSAPQTETPTGG